MRACATGTAEAEQPTLNTEAAEQIAALQKIKRSLTPAERKLDTRLAMTLRRRASPAAVRAVSRLRTGVAVSSSDRTEVELHVDAVTGDLLDRLQRAGVKLRSLSKAEALRTIAGWREVRRVGVATAAFTAGELESPAGGSQARQGEAARGADRRGAGEGAAAQQARSAPRATGRMRRTRRARRRASPAWA